MISILTEITSVSLLSRAITYICICCLKTVLKEPELRVLKALEDSIKIIQKVTQTDIKNEIYKQFMIYKQFCSDNYMQPRPDI